MTLVGLHVLLLAVTGLAASTTQQPQSCSPNTPFPLNETDNGCMTSPYRMLLKLDCPGCTSDEKGKPEESTALIYDFRINPSPDSPRKNIAVIGPQIELNGAGLYPPRKSLGGEEKLWYKAPTVSSDTTLDAYLSDTDPQRYHLHGDNSILKASAVAYEMPNAHGWDIFSLIIETAAYNVDEDTRGQGVDIRGDGINGLALFLRRHNTTNSILRQAEQGFARNGNARMRDKLIRHQQTWTLEWWHEFPWRLVREKGGDLGSEMMAEMPAGLEGKLLREMEEEKKKGQRVDKGRKSRIWPWTWFKIIGIVLVIVSLVYMFGYAVFVSTRTIAYAGYLQVLTWMRRSKEDSEEHDESSGEAREGEEGRIMLK